MLPLLLGVYLNEENTLVTGECSIHHGFPANTFLCGWWVLRTGGATEVCSIPGSLKVTHKPDKDFENWSPDLH